MADFGQFAYPFFQLAEDADGMRWQADKTQDGRWRTTIAVPLHGPLHTGNAIVSAHVLSPDKAEAVHKAALIAQHIVTNPVLQAMMPPQVQVAIQGAQLLSAAYRQGNVHEVLQRFAGPAAERLLDFLHRGG